MGRNMGGWVKMKEQKMSSIDVVSYASKLSGNGVTCVFQVHFWSSDTFQVCKLCINIHISTKTYVTGKNLVLYSVSCFTFKLLIVDSLNDIRTSLWLWQSNFLRSCVLDSQTVT